MSNTRTLTLKQAAFVREYLKDFNGTQAAIRAGYSPNGARQQASQLLTNPAIQKHMDEYSKAAKTAAVMSLTELQEWWTTAVLGGHADDGAEYRDRQKASEFLARSQGGFTEAAEHSGEVIVRVVRGN